MTVAPQDLQELREFARKLHAAVDTIEKLEADFETLRKAADLAANTLEARMGRRQRITPGMQPAVRELRGALRKVEREKD